jgi:hypothetical protein
MSLTICGESGKALTETVDDVTFPADYSFETVNDYVHGMDASFEDLQSLCLGMATHIEKLQGMMGVPVKLLGYEENRAILESTRNEAEDAYFSARHVPDGDLARKFFKDGFERGWDKKP